LSKIIGKSRTLLLSSSGAEAMKNFIISIVSLFFFAILWICPAKADTGSSDLVKKVQPATVMIYVFDRSGKPICQGSGFFFQYYGHLITNYHVLGKAAIAKAKTPDGREFNIKAILAEDQPDDLIEALADISYGSAPYLIPAGAAPSVGDPVMVIGSPLGVDKVVSLGNVNAVMEVSKLGRCIVHSAHSFPGSSGSPVVNARGEVIGIETAGGVGNPNINVAIPAERFSGLTPNFRELQTPANTTTEAQAGVQLTNTRPEALRKDTQMAESGDSAAQVRLAARYEKGQDLSQNCFEALGLYRKAADQGNVQAQYHLGCMYYSGECMGQNLGEAARWLKMAAERGLPDAQRDFGRMCINGEGVARDPVAGCMWIVLAASRGNAGANSLLRLISAELTQEQLSMGREKARNWTPVP
jgi:S1-C subfamily serine protease